MKKTVFAGLLLATLSTANMSAKTLTTEQPKTEQCCKTVVTYVTETVGTCVITYKVTTTYFLCFTLCTKKEEVKRDCSGNGGGNF